MKVMAFLTLMLTFSLCSCSKTDANNSGNDLPNGTFVFYKTGSPNDKWDVIINDQDYGPVPKTGAKPTCKTNKGLEVSLKPGTYTIYFKKLSDNTTSTPKQVMLNSDECKPYELQ